MALQPDQIPRYSRQIVLGGVGGSGQERLLNSRVLIVGAGGLGSPVAYYLAAAGVGSIVLIDGDTVDISNLHRQILHFTPDLGRPKAESGAEKLRNINPDVTVACHTEPLSSENALDIVSRCDFVVEGTDSFSAKYLVNDACVLTDTPFSHGGILRYQGQTMTHIPGSASYRCAYPNPPEAAAVPTCAEAGVFGAVAGMIGTIQAAEAIKCLLGIGELLTDKLLMLDALTMEVRSIAVPRTEYARVASENSRITGLAAYGDEQRM